MMANRLASLRKRRKPPEEACNSIQCWAVSKARYDTLACCGQHTAVLRTRMGRILPRTGVACVAISCSNCSNGCMWGSRVAVSLQALLQAVYDAAQQHPLEVPTSLATFNHQQAYAYLPSNLPHHPKGVDVAGEAALQPQQLLRGAVGNGAHCHSYRSERGNEAIEGGVLVGQLDAGSNCWMPVSRAAV